MLAAIPLTFEKVQAVSAPTAVRIFVKPHIWFADIQQEK